MLARPVMISDRVIALIILCIIAIMYLLLPRAGDIWAADASSHALNGAFVLDFLRAMPIHHPLEFAFDYYRQWPALSIGFYPPLFYGELAISYAMFGVSEAAALIPEMISLFGLSWGVYRLSQNWLDNTSALAVVFLTIGAPSVSFWGQQVMLDVPAYAWLIWAAVFHLRYLKTAQPRTLYFSVLCVVAAIYTKYNAAFFVGVIAISLLYVRGWRSVLQRTSLKAAALGFVLLMPLLVIFFKVSAFNLEQAFSLQGGGIVSRWSLSELTYYARIMPAVVSWPTAVLALWYCFGSLIVRQMRLSKLDTAFLLIWIAFGYVFYTMIAVKEPRHILFITYPLILAAALLLKDLTTRLFLGSLPVVAVAIAVMVSSLVSDRPPDVTGVQSSGTVHW